MTAGSSGGGERSERDEALGRLAEELAGAVDRGAGSGELPDDVSLAARFGLSESDVARCRRAVAAMRVALAEDLPADEAPPLPPPDLPDDYEVQAEIGRGGMGVVYRAYQRSLDRTVAVKVLRPGELLFANALARFRREARSLGKLRHRHIVAIHEVGDAGGNLYYSMDLVEGGSLAQLVARGEVTPARAVRLLRQVASAIAFTHSHGLIHRDLKPGNILIDDEGDALVADFGLARDAGAAGGGASTSGHVLGTPDYMSPEQAKGDGARIGEATDVYGLGAILYACLAGAAPFAGLALADKIHAVVYEEPRALRRLNPKVPRDLALVCAKAMAKKPEDRYATAHALLQDLERFEEGRPIFARAPSAAARARRALTAYRRELTAAALMLLLVAPVLWAMQWASAESAGGSRVADADALYEAGEYRAALLFYERALDPELSGEMSARDRFFADWGIARCRVELGSEARAAGREDEARSEVAEAEELLRACEADVRASGAGWLERRDAVRADLAIALVAGAKTDEATEVFASFGEPGGWADRTGALLDAMAPRMADPKAAGHAAGMLLLAQGLDWDSRGVVGHWLAGREQAAGILASLLSALDGLPEGSRERVLRGLFVTGALLDPEFLLERAPAVAPALAALARDEEQTEEVRALAIAVFSEVMDLPVHPTMDGLRPAFDQDALDGILEFRSSGPVCWGGICGVGGREARLTPLVKDVERYPEALRESGLQWLAEVFGPRWRPTTNVVNASGSIFRRLGAGLALEDLVRRLRTGNDAPLDRRLLHLLLMRLAPEGFVPPVWPVWGNSLEPRGFGDSWMRLFEPNWETPPYRLRVASFAFHDGHPEPELVFEHDVTLHVGESVDLELAGSVDWVTRNRFGSDGLHLIPERMRQARPGRYDFALRGRLEPGPDGGVLAYRHCEDALSIGGPSDSTLIREADTPILAGRVVPLILREYGWPRAGVHSSFFLTLAALDVAPEPGSWTPEDWRRRLAHEIAVDAGRIEEVASRFAPELAWTGEAREHDPEWIAALSPVERATMVNQWLLASYLPVPECADALDGVHRRLRAALDEAELYGVIEGRRSAWLESAPGPRFAKSGVILVAARLAAGDPLAMIHAPRIPAVAEWSYGRTVWQRMTLASPLARVRAFAAQRWNAEGPALAAVETVHRLARERGVDLPEWVAARAAGAPARVRSATLSGAWYYAVLGLVLILLDLYCVLYLVRGRGTPGDRVGAAAWAIWLAVVSTDKAFDLGALTVSLEPVGYLCGAVGAWWLARLGSGRSRLAFLGFSLALALDLASRAGALGTSGLPLSRLAMALAIAGLPMLTERLPAEGQRARWNAGRLPRRVAQIVFLPLVLVRMAGELAMASGWSWAVRPVRWIGLLMGGSLSRTRIEANLALVAYLALWFIVGVVVFAGIARARFEKERAGLATTALTHVPA